MSVSSINQVSRPLLVSVLSAAALFFAPASNALQNEELTINQALLYCSSLESETEKLSCFEALASTANDGAKPSSRSAEAESAEKDADNSAEVKETATRKKGRFFGLFGGGDDDDTFSAEKVEESPEQKEDLFVIRRADSPIEKRRKREPYDAEVYRAWRNGEGDLRVAFRSGEIWRELDATMGYDPQPGEKAEFRPGALGSWTVYFFDGERGLLMSHMNGD